MTAPLDITAVQAGNAPAYGLLAQLQAAAFGKQDEAPWSADDFRQLVESPGMHVLVASHGSTPVGYILFRAVLDEAELISMAVGPEHQGLGTGRALLAAAVEFLRTHDIQKFFLEVRVDNDAAIRLYRVAGFEKVGQRPGYYQTLSGKRVDAFCFALTIFG